MAVKFTSAFINSLKYKGHQEDITDSHPLGVSGQLCIRVGKKKMSWFIQYRQSGKRRKMNMETYPTVGLAQARKLAVQELLKISDGYNPQKEKHQQKTAPTVPMLWDEYLKSLKRKQRKKAPASLVEEQRKYNKELEPILGKLKVKDVTPMILNNLLDNLADRAPVQANRVHSLLSIMFKPALKLGWITVHPLQWVDRPAGQELPRKRVLSDEEIKQVWPQFNRVNANPRDILKLGLYTAQRPGEITRMRWEDIDFKENIWTIRNTKNGTDHIVPLSRQVQDILLVRKMERLQDEWVFWSRSSKRGYVSASSVPRSMVKKLSGVTGWTSHDLRRTGRTIMARLGIEPHICERVLNHAQGGIQAVYDLYGYMDEKRDALDKLAHEIDTIRYSCVDDEGALACSPEQQKYIDEHPEDYYLTK